MRVIFFILPHCAHHTFGIVLISQKIFNQARLNLFLLSAWVLLRICYILKTLAWLIPFMFTKYVLTKLVLLISQKPLLWQQNNACRILTWSLKSVAFEYQPCQLIVYNARVILTRKSWKFTKCERLFFCQKWLQKHLGILFCIRYDRIMIGYWIKSQKFSK